jgi:hypothetical protein
VKKLKLKKQLFGLLYKKRCLVYNLCGARYWHRLNFVWKGQEYAMYVQRWIRGIRRLRINYIDLHQVGCGIQYRTVNKAELIKLIKEINEA